MRELILRRSEHHQSKPWALQLRYHGPAETDYAHVAHVTEDMAYMLADAGSAFFLHGDHSPTVAEIFLSLERGEIDEDQAADKLAERRRQSARFRKGVDAAIRFIRGQTRPIRQREGDDG